LEREGEEERKTLTLFSKNKKIRVISNPSFSQKKEEGDGWKTRTKRREGLFFPGGGGKRGRKTGHFTGKGKKGVSAWKKKRGKECQSLLLSEPKGNPP